MIQEVKKAFEDGTLKVHHAFTCPRYLKGCYFTTQYECRCSVFPVERAAGIEEAILWIDVAEGRRYTYEELTLEHINYIVRTLGRWMRDTSASQDTISSYAFRLGRMLVIRDRKLIDQRTEERLAKIIDPPLYICSGCLYCGGAAV